MTLKGVVKKDHLPEQGVLSALLISTGTVSSCRQNTLYTPTFWMDKQPMKTVSLQLEKDLSDVSQVTGDRYSVSKLFSQCCIVCCYIIVNELAESIRSMETSIWDRMSQ